LQVTNDITANSGNVTTAQLQKDLNILRALESAVSQKIAALQGQQPTAANQASIQNLSNQQTQISQQLGNKIDQIKSQIQNMNSMMQGQTQDLDQKNQEITEKNQRSLMQRQEIIDKEKLIITRDRMLQVSEEKNVYKKKIIYTLLSLIIAIFIIMLVGYVYFNKTQLAAGRM
jgi:seryl-tRNA synthetase